MTQWGAVSPTYDLNGNLTNDGSRTLTWDARDRLTAIAGTASFAYDAFGRRQSKTIGSATTAFVYDGLNSVQELSSGAPVANLVTGLAVDRVFTRTTSAGARHFLNDGLVSTLALTDGTGAIQTQYAYEPYGNATPSGAANDNSYQYTGRENDGTGLYYYRARYYNPVWQRFISEDPIGLRGGIDLYRYVNNNPLQIRDPMGIDPKQPNSCPSGPGVALARAMVSGGRIAVNFGESSSRIGTTFVLVGAGASALGAPEFGAPLAVGGAALVTVGVPALIGGLVAEGFGGLYLWWRGDGQPAISAGAQAAQMALEKLLHMPDLPIGVPDPFDRLSAPFNGRDSCS